MRGGKAFPAAAPHDSRNHSIAGASSLVERKVDSSPASTDTQSARIPPAAAISMGILPTIDSLPEGTNNRPSSERLTNPPDLAPPQQDCKLPSIAPKARSKGEQTTTQQAQQKFPAAAELESLMIFAACINGPDKELAFLRGDSADLDCFVHETCGGALGIHFLSTIFPNATRLDSQLASTLSREQLARFMIYLAVEVGCILHYPRGVYQGLTESQTAAGVSHQNRWAALEFWRACARRWLTDKVDLKTDPGLSRLCSVADVDELAVTSAPRLLWDWAMYYSDDPAAKRKYMCGKPKRRRPKWLAPPADFFFAPAIAILEVEHDDITLNPTSSVSDIRNSVLLYLKNLALKKNILPYLPLSSDELDSGVGSVSSRINFLATVFQVLGSGLSSTIGPIAIQRIPQPELRNRVNCTLRGWSNALLPLSDARDYSERSVLNIRGDLRDGVTLMTLVVEVSHRSLALVLDSGDDCSRSTSSTARSNLHHKLNMGCTNRFKRLSNCKIACGRLEKLSGVASSTVDIRADEIVNAVPGASAGALSRLLLHHATNSLETLECISNWSVQMRDEITLSPASPSLRNEMRCDCSIGIIAEHVMPQFADFIAQAMDRSECIRRCVVAARCQGIPCVLHYQDILSLSDAGDAYLLGLLHAAHSRAPEADASCDCTVQSAE